MSSAKWRLFCLGLNVLNFRWYGSIILLFLFVILCLLIDLKVIAGSVNPADRIFVTCYPMINRHEHWEIMYMKASGSGVHQCFFNERIHCLP